MWVGTKTKLGYVCYAFLGREIRKRPEQMARRLEEDRHWSRASTGKNPTGDSCSVACASPTSFSQSVTPFPLGLWGCTLLPASLCPELLWGVPQLSHGAHLPHSGKNTEMYCKILSQRPITTVVNSTVFIGL